MWPYGTRHGGRGCPGRSGMARRQIPQEIETPANGRSGEEALRLGRRLEAPSKPPPTTPSTTSVICSTELPTRICGPVRSMHGHARSCQQPEPTQSQLVELTMPSMGFLA